MLFNATCLKGNHSEYLFLQRIFGWDFFATLCGSLTAREKEDSIDRILDKWKEYVDCKDVNNIRSNQVLDLGIQNYIQKDIQGDIPDREFRECIQGWLWRELWGGLTVTTSRGNYITFIYLSFWKLALKKCSKSERKFLLSESVDCSL